MNKPLIALILGTATFLAFMIYGVDVYAADIEDTATYTSMSGREIITKGIGMHTPYNAKRLLNVMKNPFGHNGMKVCSEINIDTAYFTSYDAQLTCMISDMEKILGQIKESPLLSSNEKQALTDRYSRWIGETRYTKEIIEVPVMTECTEERVFEKIKDMTLSDLLSLTK